MPASRELQFWLEEATYNLLIMELLRGIKRAYSKWIATFVVALPFLLTVILTFQPIETQGQLTEPGAKVTLRSRSAGQFIAKGVPFPPTVTSKYEGVVQAVEVKTVVEWPKKVRLDPATAIVICDRIKQVFLQELGISDQWQGIIELDIDFYVNGINRPILLSHRFLSDGLHTTMRVSDEVTPHRLVQAVTQVLLLELANRDHKQLKMAEIPLWMTEGMTQLIMERTGPSLIPLPGTPQRFSTQTTSPTRHAKARLRTINNPPSFTTLANPGPEWTEGIPKMIFQDASLVLTHELLTRIDGQKNFLQTILRLKKYLNWQTAFLDAWKETFPSLTDVEKWWAIVLVINQDDTAPGSLSFKRSVEKLNEILSEASVTSVGDIHAAKRPSSIHIQQVATSWTATVQAYFFERMATQLDVFALAAEPRVANLAKRYQEVLLDYIHQPQILAFFGKDAPSRIDLKVLRKRLEDLDTERALLQMEASQIQDPPSSYDGK